MRTLSPSRPSVDILWRKNCSENEASNWTPGGHIRARGDRRRWRMGRRKSEAGKDEPRKWERKKDAESETEMRQRIRYRGGEKMSRRENDTRKRCRAEVKDESLNSRNNGGNGGCRSTIVYAQRRTVNRNEKVREVRESRETWWRQKWMRKGRRRGKASIL